MSPPMPSAEQIEKYTEELKHKMQQKDWNKGSKKMNIHEYKRKQKQFHNHPSRELSDGPFESTGSKHEESKKSYSSPYYKGVQKSKRAKDLHYSAKSKHSANSNEGQGSNSSHYNGKYRPKAGSSKNASKGGRMQTLDSAEKASRGTKQQPVR